MMNAIPVNKVLCEDKKWQQAYDGNAQILRSHGNKITDANDIKHQMSFLVLHINQKTRSCIH